MLLRPNREDLSFRNGRELLPEGRHLAIQAIVSRVRETGCDSLVRNELQVSGEVHVRNERSILLGAGEFGESDRTHVRCNLLKFSLDRLALTHVGELADVSLEVVGKEVVAAAWAPAGVGNVVHGVHAVSSELESHSGSQAVSLWNQEVALRETHKTVRFSSVKTSIVVVSKVDPLDSAGDTLGVVNLDARVGQLITYEVEGEVHVSREKRLHSDPVLRLGANVGCDLIPELVKLIVSGLRLVEWATKSSVSTG